MPLKKGFLARAPFTVCWHQQVAAATLLTDYTLFSNPAANNEDYELLGVDAIWDVNSTSGTVSVENVPAGTAAASGTVVLTTTLDLSTGARTAVKGVLSATRTDRYIMRGRYLSMVLGGTLTSLVGLSVTVWLQAMRGIRGR